METEKGLHEALKYGHKYRFMTVSSIFRFASFVKNFKGEDEHRLFRVILAVMDAILATA